MIVIVGCGSNVGGGLSNSYRFPFKYTNQKHNRTNVIKKYTKRKIRDRNETS